MLASFGFSLHLCGIYFLDSSNMMGNFREALNSVPGKFLGIVGQDPSDSKLNRLVHVRHLPVFPGDNWRPRSDRVLFACPFN